MTEFDNVQILAAEEHSRRIDRGLMVPMHSGTGLELVDCADFRPLTPEAVQERADTYGAAIIPARFYGAANGIVQAGLTALAAQDGEAAVKEVLGDRGPEAVMRLTAELSHTALHLYGLTLNRHSAASNEAGNPRSILFDHPHPDTPLGCKFDTFTGPILTKSRGSLALRKAQQVRSLAGIAVPLEEASAGIEILGGYLSPTLSITRDTLNKARSSGYDIPTTVLQDSPLAPAQVTAVMDLGGFRSDAGPYEGEYRSFSSHPKPGPVGKSSIRAV
jgi:hypothetical protein